MKNFYLYNDRVEIVKNDGSIFTIYFNENSGKVYFRYKIGTISQVKHPGIFLGVDANGVGYFLHNHYHYGKAHITTQQEFVKGMPLYIYNEILRGEHYKPITYNCQTYTNTACHNQRKSDDAEKWVGGVLLGSLALLLLSASFGSKR